MTFDELPKFLQDRFLAMKPEVREAMLQSIDQGWVDCQVAGQAIVKGLEEGKWTVEDIRKEMTK
jgi:hypothetical protein